jgi:hypothetical protein
MHFEKIINTIYSFGAAIVVFGAWGKLEHKDFGDTALTVGLLVETGIFCVYGLMEWRKNSEQPEQVHRPAEKVDVGELTTTMKQTNQILNKVFKAD